jgi:uncharacterized protein YaiL (DUF2058 family)
MASIDLSSSYESAKNKISATKSYVDLKNQYLESKKKAGSSFETSKQFVTDQIDSIKEDQKKFQRQIKTQFEELLDINNVTGGKGSNSVTYIKRQLIKAVKNITPRISEILLEESIKAVGCDQQQTYIPQTIYVKVKSIDLSGILKLSPSSPSGRVLYEKENIVVQTFPFAMNKELYNRVSNLNLPFSTQYSTLYKGESTQPLFDITFVQVDNNFQQGPWFKIDLQNRLSGPNKAQSPAPF